MSENPKSLSFCLLQLDEAGDLEEVYEAVRSLEGVTSCQPIRNQYHLIAKIETESFETNRSTFLDKFQNEPGIQRLDFLASDISKAYRKPSTTDNGKEEYVTSYVIFEVDPACLPVLITDLQKIPFVTACYPTTGAYDLLVEMKAPSFSKLHRTLTGEIRPLDGIRRCWMLNVINIKQI